MLGSKIHVFDGLNQVTGGLSSVLSMHMSRYMVAAGYRRGGYGRLGRSGADSFKYEAE
jgi:hypothetical protein